MGKQRLFKVQQVMSLSLSSVDATDFSTLFKAPSRQSPVPRLPHPDMC
jgi:hypothetical protein